MVVVDRYLRERIIAREQLSTRDILAGSVQIWTDKIEFLGIDRLPARREIYWWPHPYDPEFLGYMEGALKVTDFIAQGGAVI